MQFLSILFLTFFFFSVPSYAQDSAQKFNIKCMKSGKTAGFCTCALNAFSDHMRKSSARKLEKKKMHLKYNTDSLLADSVMTQDKINAVCDLHDEAHSYDLKAALVRREQGPEQASQWIEKKLSAMKQKEELVMSYGASRETNGALIVGDYCKLNNEVNQMSQDLSEGNDVIFAKVRRSIDAGVGVAPFFRSAHKAGCK